MGPPQHVLSGAGMNPCAANSLPQGSGTFAALYESDGNHPSLAGCYLQSLILASSMTGAHSSTAPPMLLLCLCLVVWYRAQSAV